MRLALAIAPHLVDDAQRKTLPPLGISLSSGIKQGATGFAQLGMERAYTGAPAEASEGEGEAWLAVLEEMIVTEVEEALAAG